jgi:hypothetical protein
VNEFRKCEDQKRKVISSAKGGAEENVSETIQREVHLRGQVASKDENAHRDSV